MPLCPAETLDLSSGCSPAVCFVFLSRQQTQGHSFTDQGTEAKAGVLSLHHLILIRASHFQEASLQPCQQEFINRTGSHMGSVS